MRIPITCHAVGPCIGCNGCDSPTVDLRAIEWPEAPSKKSALILQGGKILLTPRERDAARTLHLGIKDACRSLGIKPGTLKIYRNTLFAKLGKSGREAMRLLNGVAL